VSFYGYVIDTGKLLTIKKARVKKLPEDLKILKTIGERLDSLMTDSYTSVEIRSSELYDYAVKDKFLSSKFLSQIDFNRFLRKQYDKGYLKQIIPNCRVDDTNKDFYQWHFRKKSRPSIKPKNSSGINGNYIHFRNNLNIQTSDNTFVRSEQEKLIYESLIKHEELNVVYDYQLVYKGKRKNVDFFIENLKDNTQYYWEHFGMTNDEGYLSKIPKTIIWYQNAGFENITEENGNLIFTYYKELGVFQREIDNIISLILYSGIPSPNYQVDIYAIPLVEIYISGKVNYTSSKGHYALLLKHQRANLKHQKSFTKSFYLASAEKIILSAISDGLAKLKRTANVIIYLNSDKLIRVLNQVDKIDMYSEIIENILEYTHKHQISFRKVFNPMKNLLYLETEELLLIEKNNIG
jgi:ribonuclease HI